MNKIAVFINPNPGSVNIGTTFDSPWGQTKSFGDLIGLTLTGAITIAGIIALVLLVGGGIGMIASAGKSDPQGAAKSKTAVTMGAFGFIIVVTAYFVIRIIEIISGTSFVTSPIF